MTISTIDYPEAPAAASIAGIAAAAIVVLCVYVSWRALKGDEKNAFARNMAIAS